MNTLAALCMVVLVAFLSVGTCLDPAGGKVVPSGRLLDKRDVLQEDGNFDPLAPVSQHSELFEIAKRIAHKKDSLEGREAYGYGGYAGYGNHRNNMDRFEHFTKQFMELSIDLSYSAVYLLQNYTRFVQNVNNKYLIVFE
uniref:Secreted protein n=1 Tax=Anopheles atroparvus TaxID=41427 RepID=A0AAG5D5J4_ANOAO